MVDKDGDKDHKACQVLAITLNFRSMLPALHQDLRLNTKQTLQFFYHHDSLEELQFDYFSIVPEAETHQS